MSDVAPNANETTIGIFHLLNPPTPDDVEVIRATVAHIDFPLEAVVRPYLAKHFLGDTVTVQWLEQNEGAATASWWGTGQIDISTQFTSWRDDLPFVFAHECGHMVDSACLTAADHAALTPLMLAGPGLSGMLAHSNSGQYYRHPNEDWADTVDNDYVARPCEAYADQFVKVFATALWDGTATDVPSRQHSPRFVHYNDRDDDFRRILTAAAARITTPPTPAPAPAPAPVPRPVTMTRGKQIDDALHSINDWMRRNPKSRDRLKVRLAQKVLRSIKPRKA